MKKNNSLLSIILLLICALTITACGKNEKVSDSKGYPEKDIKYIVPYSAGGSSDQMARLMVKYFSEHAGKNLIIENIPGGGGNVGLSTFATESPDGYTISSFNTSANLQPIYGNTKYDYMEIFDPIALCVSIPIAVAVPSDSPFDTIEELIDYAKENPGKLQYGHAGIGSITHVTAELFKQEAGIDMEQVPFGSGNDALTALLGSHIDVDVSAFSEVWPQSQQGLVKILALCSDKDIEGIPTLKSKGYDVDMLITQGVCTLQDVPEEIKVKLDDIFNKVINDENYQEELRKVGMEVDYRNREDFNKFVKDQRKQFEEIVSSSGIDKMVKENQK